MLRRLKVRTATISVVWMALLSFTSFGQSANPDVAVNAETSQHPAAPAIGADVGAGWNILSIHWSAFEFTAGSYGIQIGGLGYLRVPEPSLFAPMQGYYASVQLPTGTAIGRIGLFAYDNEPTRDVRMRLMRYSGFGSVAGCNPCGPPDPPAEEVIGQVSSAGAPGYQYASANLFQPHVVDNYVHLGGGQYVVEVYMNPETDYGLGFRGVEIWWKRQISPAPSVASFVDVPTTHLFFREIEALAAAGITLGCTATEFCASLSVTRAQMAAFLARALGLYWQY